MRQATSATHPKLPGITLELEPYGARGWQWKWSDKSWWYRTNEQGGGLWEAESQIKGTMQYSLPSSAKRTANKLLRRRLAFEYPYDNMTLA